MLYNERVLWFVAVNQRLTLNLKLIDEQPSIKYVCLYSIRVSL